MLDGERHARIAAAVTRPDDGTGVGGLIYRLCRLAAEELMLSGCAMVLMSGNMPLGMLGGTGRHAAIASDLQFELGEGPGLHACRSGNPVLLPDLAADGAQRWPAFAPAAVAAGIKAEFALPLTEGPHGIGALDMCRDEPGMLTEHQLADAFVAADIARDAVLSLQERAANAALAPLIDSVGTDRLVVHQAVGMLAAQLDESTVNALARLRAAGFESGRSIYDIAQDVVARRVRFDE